MRKGRNRFLTVSCSVSLVILCIVLVGLPCVSFAETIQVSVEGFSSRNSGNRQHDYREAVLDAKKKALEQAGVKIESTTTVKNYQLHEKYIESKCEGVLLPSFHITKVGYAEDRLYHVFLTGKIKVTEDQSFGYVSLPVGFIYDDRPEDRVYDDDKWKIDDMPLSNHNKVSEYIETNEKGNWKDIYWKVKVPSGKRKITCFAKYAYFNVNVGRTLKLGVFDFQNW